jgi:hypothetical protein
MQHPTFSVLRTWTPRPLPIALAHKFVVVKMDDPYAATLRRLYRALPPQDRTACQAELARRAAQMAAHGACRSNGQEHVALRASGAER